MKAPFCKQLASLSNCRLLSHQSLRVQLLLRIDRKLLRDTCGMYTCCFILQYVWWCSCSPTLILQQASATWLSRWWHLSSSLRAPLISLLCCWVTWTITSTVWSTTSCVGSCCDGWGCGGFGGRAGGGACWRTCSHGGISSGSSSKAVDSTSMASWSGTVKVCANSDCWMEWLAIACHEECHFKFQIWSWDANVVRFQSEDCLVLFSDYILRLLIAFTVMLLFIATHLAILNHSDLSLCPGDPKYWWV